MEAIATLILQGRYPEALRQLESADNQDPAVHVERGRAFAGLKQYAKSAEAFKLASERYAVLGSVSEQLANTQKHSDTQKNSDTSAKAEETSPIIVDQSPTLPNPKFDWFQSDTHVFISISAKKVKANEIVVDIKPKTVEVVVFDKCRLQIASYALLDPTKSSFSLTEYKIELKLCKLVPGTWPQLEAENIPLGPTATVRGVSSADTLPKPYASGKATKDWSKLEKEAEAETEEDSDPLNKLLKQIYKDADEDTRRAMMKSYQTSGGTVLTTNWKEAKGKDFAKEVKPPKGQVYKSWEGDVIAEGDTE